MYILTIFRVFMVFYRYKVYIALYITHFIGIHSHKEMKPEGIVYMVAHTPPHHHKNTRLLSAALVYSLEKEGRRTHTWYNITRRDMFRYHNCKIILLLPLYIYAYIIHG